MPRLVNGERKIPHPKPENAGKLLIFCEGYTEYNYLVYFKDYLENNLYVKYSDIVIEPINAKGNAMQVYNYAEKFLLVMHFQNLNPKESNSKREIIRLMRDYLEVAKYTSSVKAAKGTIGKILGSNGNEKIRSAIENAKELEKYWQNENKIYLKDIVKMNPSVDVYKLIERLLDEIVYLCG